MRSGGHTGGLAPILVAASTSSMALSGSRVSASCLPLLPAASACTACSAQPLLLLSDMMERALINTFVGHDVVEPGNYVQMFPYPCYTRDE